MNTRILLKIDKNSKKTSSGIIVIYKKILEKHLKCHITESQFTLWFTISKTVLSLTSDVLFGCVYMPPDNSRYSNADAFVEQERELLSFLKLKKSCCFNWRF